jgi:hypothetical protein
VCVRACVCVCMCVCGGVGGGGGGWGVGVLGGLGGGEIDRSLCGVSRGEQWRAVALTAHSFACCVHRAAGHVRDAADVVVDGVIDCSYTYAHGIIRDRLSLLYSHTLSHHLHRPRAHAAPLSTQHVTPLGSLHKRTLPRRLDERLGASTLTHGVRGIRSLME